MKDVMSNKLPYWIAVVVEIALLTMMIIYRDRFELVILSLVIGNSLLHMCTDFMENPQKKYWSASFRFIAVVVALLVYFTRNPNP